MCVDLTQDQVKKFMQTETPSCKTFQFRYGNLVYPTRYTKLPAKKGLTKCQIETEVVKIDIPVLLSKMSLMKAGTIMDMEKDSEVIINKK